MRTTRRPRCPKHPLLQPRSPRLRRDYFPTFCHHHSSHIQLLISFSSNEVHLVPPVLQHIYLELGVLCSKSRPRPRFCIIARCCSRFALLEMGVWCPVSYSLDPFGCFHGHELRPRLCRTPVGICSISALASSHEHAYLPPFTNPTTPIMASSSGFPPREGYRHIVPEHSASDYQHIPLSITP